MAKMLTLDEAKEMSVNLFTIFGRYDIEKSFSFRAQNVDTELLSEEDVIGSVIDMFVEEFADVLGVLENISPAAFRRTLLSVGLAIGMRYSYDFGTPEHIQESFIELPMFEGEDNGK